LLPTALRLWGWSVTLEYIEKQKGRQSRKVELRTTATMGKAKIAARCHWASNDLSILYHDEEWGVPLHDDRRLLEFLILEGAQAGLSWDTILRKRAGYRAAFDGFDPHLVAGYRARKIRQLLRNSGIVRNRLKIHSAIQNSQAFLKVQEEFGSFDAYIWQFVGGQPKQNAWRTLQQLPASTAASDAMSKDLKRRGFNFVGSTICYAFMQAVGMVNDHVVECFRYAELNRPSGEKNGLR
jgi:DNA-3-methyladenine glycosylase I